MAALCPALRSKASTRTRPAASGAILGAGGVARAVVHEDDLVIQPGEGGGEFALEDGHVFLLVVKRHDDGKRRGRGLIGMGFTGRARDN